MSKQETLQAIQELNAFFIEYNKMLDERQKRLQKLITTQAA